MGAQVPILRNLGRGLAVQLIAYASLLLGFLFLYEGFSGPSIPLGLLGGTLIIAGMWLLAFSRRVAGSERQDSSAPIQEDKSGDSLN